MSCWVSDPFFLRQNTEFNLAKLFLCHPKKDYFKTTVTQTLTTVGGMKITPLLRYPPQKQLVITVNASFCITAAHYHQSTNFSNSPRK
jgi:hypothetical protein